MGNFSNGKFLRREKFGVFLELNANDKIILFLSGKARRIIKYSPGS